MKIAIVDGSPQWGLVQLVDEQDAIVRQYRITAEEAAAVHAGGVPPGMTEEEWHSGRASVGDRPLLEWQAIVQPNGWLTVNYGITEADGLVSVKTMDVPPSEWTRDGDEAVLVASVWKKMGVKP